MFDLRVKHNNPQEGKTRLETNSRVRRRDGSILHREGNTHERKTGSFDAAANGTCSKTQHLGMKNTPGHRPRRLGRRHEANVEKHKVQKEISILSEGISPGFRCRC